MTSTAVEHRGRLLWLLSVSRKRFQNERSHLQKKRRALFPNLGGAWWLSRWLWLTHRYNRPVRDTCLRGRTPTTNRNQTSSGRSLTSGAIFPFWWNRNYSRLRVSDLDTMFYWCFCLSPTETGVLLFDPLSTSSVVKSGRFCVVISWKKAPFIYSNYQMISTSSTVVQRRTTRSTKPPDEQPLKNGDLNNNISKPTSKVERKGPLFKRLLGPFLYRYLCYGTYIFWFITGKSSWRFFFEILP